MGDKYQTTGKPSLEDAGDRDADRDRDGVDRLGGLPEEGRTGLLFGGSRSPSIPVKVLYAIPSAKKTVRL